MKLIIIDNYDSFTYNLVQYFQTFLKGEVVVFRNDEITVAEVEQYDAIVLSPGPGLPKDAGIMPEVIKTYAGKKPILGICLGEQAIAEAFGGRLYNLERVFHGIETSISITDSSDPIFKNFPKSIKVGRYHSWAVDRSNLPSVLEITAEDEKGVIMAIKHKEYPISGLQFHPESIMTSEGMAMLKNWVNYIESLKTKLA